MWNFTEKIRYQTLVWQTPVWQILGKLFQVHVTLHLLWFLGKFFVRTKKIKKNQKMFGITNVSL